ncbi:MAG: DUF2855 family protein [Bacteroidota bacterium]
MQNPQFQVDRSAFFRNRINNIPQQDLTTSDGELLVQIEKFAYTANNITYAVAGDQIGYWQFFPPAGEQAAGWGVIPVWGFTEVVESKVADIPVGERLYGYFPPAKYLKMKPGKITDTRFIEASEHRLELPAGYNFYRRVNNEPHYDTSIDQEMMLLFPLLLTAFCLWDALKEKSWFDAQQIIILSASSKTSIGLGYALKDDPDAPKVVGITSARNLENVQNLNLYDQSLTYDQLAEVANVPTVIVDMSGNAKVLATLHTQLGDNMKFTSNVGLTHWTDAKPQPGIIAERSKFFFAPSRIQKRMKEWGVTTFNQKTTGFMLQTALKTRSWLTYRQLNGLIELAAVHPDVCKGKMPSNEGLIVNL